LINRPREPPVPARYGREAISSTPCQNPATLLISPIRLTHRGRVTRSSVPGATAKDLLVNSSALREPRGADAALEQFLVGKSMMLLSPGREPSTQTRCRPSPRDAGYNGRKVALVGSNVALVPSSDSNLSPQRAGGWSVGTEAAASRHAFRCVVLTKSTRRESPSATPPASM